MIKIKQATAKGWIECCEGGVADLTYPRSTTRRGRVQDGGRICPTITANKGELYKMSENVYRIRKLTPKETWRLMGFGIQNEDGTWNDECFEKAEAINSNTQLYKQAGNSVVVDCIYYIMKNLLKENDEMAKPIVFNYRDYEELKEKSEVQESLIAEMQNKIANLEIENRILKARNSNE